MDKPIRKRKPKSIRQLGIHQKLELCQAFDSYISTGATGTLEELAEKFEINEQVTQEILIYMMDELGCPISYSQQRRTYYYSEKGKLHIGFTRVEDM